MPAPFAFLPFPSETMPSGAKKGATRLSRPPAWGTPPRAALSTYFVDNRYTGPDSRELLTAAFFQRLNHRCTQIVTHPHAFVSPCFKAKVWILHAQACSAPPRGGTENCPPTTSRNVKILFRGLNFFLVNTQTFRLNFFSFWALFVSLFPLGTRTPFFSTADDDRKASKDHLGQEYARRQFPKGLYTMSHTQRNGKHRGTFFSAYIFFATECVGNKLFWSSTTTLF